MEKRSFELRDLRVNTEQAKAKITGYAAIFGVLSEDLGGFRERIEPGAFSGTIGGDIRALWMHKDEYPLGRTAADTLRLSEDDTGLSIEIDPPDTQWARDAMVSMQRGDVNQMSFRFDTLRDQWFEDQDGQVIRTLLDVKLYEVSPVTFPAYPQTSAQVRSAYEQFINSDTTQKGTSGGEGDEDTGQTQARLDILKKRLEIEEKYFGGTEE